MSRIILTLAVTNYLFVAMTMYTGLLSHPPEDWRVLGEDPFRYHFPLGIFTALFTILIHCLVFTYFLGTNRWVRETAAAYSLDDQYINRSRADRRRAMIAATVSILLVVLTIATGAGTHTRVWPKLLHQLVPLGTYLWMLLAYRIEYTAIEDHTELTDAVMEQVQRIRRERGLPPD